MLIRPATIDDTHTIAAYMLLAMEDIAYRFIGENSAEKAIRFLEALICKKANQYSYENCWVAEIDGEVVAVAVVYNGGNLHELREPVVREIKAMFGREFHPEDETHAGEYYIDCVGVNPAQQGKGIGSKIFLFLIDEYVRKRGAVLGLLVDKANPQAKKLYIKLGFQVVGEQTLAGKTMEHLQYF